MTWYGRKKAFSGYTPMDTDLVFAAADCKQRRQEMETKGVGFPIGCPFSLFLLIVSFYVAARAYKAEG